MSESNGSAATNKGGLTFLFTSGPAYILYNALLLAYGLLMKAGFEIWAGYLFGAFVYYTGRRAYKQIKLGQITVEGQEVQPDGQNGENK